MRFKIRQKIEQTEDGFIVNPRRQGLEIKGETFSGGTDLENFDAMAKHVKAQVSAQLSQERKQLKDRLDAENKTD